VKKISAVAAAVIALSTPVVAKDKVKDVIVYDHTKTMLVKSPSTERICQNMNVPIYGTTTQQGNASGGALIGMLLGAAGGKAVTGNDKGAAIGAIIGSMVAADKKKGNQQIVGYRQEQRCTTTYTSQQVDKANGYKVYYNINGQRFHTHSNRYVEPGKWLTLRLKVTSVFANP